MAGTNVAALATLTGAGDPWASLITYGALADGSLVLCLSRMAEHGRNLDADPRASVIITQPDAPEDPLAAARVNPRRVAVSTPSMTPHAPVPASAYVRRGGTPRSTSSTTPTSRCSS